jgi:hypothetical protein
VHFVLNKNRRIVYFQINALFNAALDRGGPVLVFMYFISVVNWISSIYSVVMSGDWKCRNDMVFNNVS